LIGFGEGPDGALTLVAGVTVNEAAQRHGAKSNRLSSWQTLARQGELMVPDVTAAEFPPPMVAAKATERPVMNGMIGLVTICELFQPRNAGTLSRQKDKVRIEGDTFLKLFRSCTVVSMP